MNQEIYDRIEDYINGKLKGNALTTFEQILAQDDTLAKEVEIFRLEKKGVQLLVEDDLRKKMQTWKANHVIKNPAATEGGSVLNIKYFLKWIIGFAVIAIVFWFLYLKPQQKIQQIPAIKKEEDLDNQPTNPLNPSEQTKQIEQKPVNPNIAHNDKKESLPPKALKLNEDDAYSALAKDFYDNPDLSNEILKGESIKNDPLESALEAWKNNDFIKVIELTQTYPKNSPIYIHSQELLAHAYFRNKNYLKAEKVFSNIIDSDSGATGEDAEWYKLLCLMALKKTKDADILINKILNASAHPKNSDAKNLMPIWVKLNTRKN